MNKEILIALGAGVLSFGAGFVTGHVILKKKVLENYNAQLAEMQNEFREALKRNSAKREPLVDSETGDIQPYSVTNPVYHPNPPITNYQKISAEIEKEEREIPVAKESESEVKKVEEDKNMIFFINGHNVGELEDYDVTVLDYYLDGAIVDETGRRVPGNELSSMFGDLPYLEKLEHDEKFETVCIRNKRLMTDYEISPNDVTYAEVLADQPWLND